MDGFWDGLWPWVYRILHVIFPSTWDWRRMSCEWPTTTRIHQKSDQSSIRIHQSSTNVLPKSLKTPRKMPRKPPKIPEMLNSAAVPPQKSMEHFPHPHRPRHDGRVRSPRRVVRGHPAAGGPSQCSGDLRGWQATTGLVWTARALLPRLWAQLGDFGEQLGEFDVVIFFRWCWRVLVGDSWGEMIGRKCWWLWVISVFWAV